MTAVHKCFFESLFFDILFPWNLYFSRFPNTVNPLWILFTSNLPCQEHLSSFSSDPHLFYVSSCLWLFLSRLVSVYSNSMKSPIRIPHARPWQNSSKGLNFCPSGKLMLITYSLPHAITETWNCLEANSQQEVLHQCVCALVINRAWTDNHDERKPRSQGLPPSRKCLGWSPGCGLCFKGHSHGLRMLARSIWWRYIYI